jgi:hypothetical protein
MIWQTRTSQGLKLWIYIAELRPNRCPLARCRFVLYPRQCSQTISGTSQLHDVGILRVRFRHEAVIQDGHLR